MSSFIVEGGYKLSGTIRPQGAKNEALQIISAVLLTKEEVRISNIPEILDIRNLILLLESMGVKVTRHEKGVYTFKADDIDTGYVMSSDFVDKCAKLRGSVMVVGPLLARFGRAYFPKPGGDQIAGLIPISSDSCIWVQSRNMTMTRRPFICMCRRDALWKESTCFWMKLRSPEQPI